MKEISEHTLVADLIEELRKIPYFVTEKHADRFKYGTPDLAVTGLQFVSRWEAKFANPDFEYEEIQSLTCRRLAKFGYCRYIIFAPCPDGTVVVYVVHPENLQKWDFPSSWEASMRADELPLFILRKHYEHARQ